LRLLPSVFRHILVLRRSAAVVVNEVRPRLDGSRAVPIPVLSTTVSAWPRRIPLTGPVIPRLLFITVVPETRRLVSLASILISLHIIISLKFKL
jgi:hypothetical protein